MSLMLFAGRSFAADSAAPTAQDLAEDLVIRLDLGRFGDPPVPRTQVSSQATTGALTGEVSTSRNESPPYFSRLQMAEGLAALNKSDEPPPKEVLGTEWRRPVQDLAAAQPQGRGGLLGSGWTLPPFRWNGAMTTTLGLAQTTTESEKSQTTFMTETASFSGRSFIVSPAVAPINGSIRVSRNSTTSLVGEGGETKTKATEFGTSVSTTYLPRSRSPTEGSYQFESTTVTGQSLLTSHVFTLAKQYSVLPKESLPEGNYLGNFSRTLNHSDGGLTFGYDSATLNANGLNYGNVALSGNGNVSRVLTQSGTQPAVYAASIGGMHHYDLEATDMALNSTGNVAMFNNGQGVSSYTGGLNTAYNWFPDPDLDLQLVGGLAGNYSLLTVPDQRTHFGSVSGTVNTSYKVWNDIAVSGAGGLAVTWSDEGQKVTGSLFLSTGYGNFYSWAKTANTEILGFTYTGGAGFRATVGLGLSQGAGSVGPIGPSSGLIVTLSGSGNQGLSRVIKIDERQNLSANLTESALATTSGFGTPASASLVHQATLDYRYVPVAGTYLNANAAFQDSRASGAGLSFTNASASARGGFDWPLSRTSRLNGTLGIQATEVLNNGGGNVGADSANNSSTAWSMSGSLNYFNSRLFGIPRVDYTAGYGLTIAPESVQSGAKIFTSHSLSQRVTYSLGKATLQVTNTFAIISGTKNVTIFGTLTRALGG